MKHSQTIPALLHDLSLIHEARIANYYQVQQHNNNLDSDLKKILMNMIEESRLLQQELEMRKSALDGVTIGKPGTVYQHWKNEHQQFNATPRQPFLVSCQAELKDLTDAYEYALTNNLLDEATRRLIDDQLQTLEAGLDRLQK